MEKQTKEKKTAPKKQAEKKEVDEGLYSKFVSLKFLSLTAKLKEEALKELEELEAELKKCSGSVPVNTVNAAIGNELIKLVQDVPVPKSIEKIIKDDGSAKYYFK